MVRRRGDLPAADAASLKITVVVLERQIAELDRLTVDMRLAHGCVLSRTDVVRALVEAACVTDCDLGGADSGESVATLLRRSWSRGR